MWVSVRQEESRADTTNKKKLDIDAHVEARKSNYVSCFFKIGQEVQWVAKRK
jgi:hypothetical protein